MIQPSQHTAFYNGSTVHCSYKDFEVAIFEQNHSCHTFVHKMSQLISPVDSNTEVKLEFFSPQQQQPCLKRLKYFYHLA